MFTYCPRCKEKLTQDRDHYSCSQCGFDYFNTPNPAASVIIVNHKNQIFLNKRAREPKTGHWEAPGGFIDFHESAEEAARREIMGELGIELNDLKIFCSYPGEYDYKGTKYYPLLIFFIAKVDLEKIEPIDPEESQSGMFFNPSEIPWNNFAFPAEAKALKDFLALT